MKVARHAMPGKCGDNDPSRRERCDLRFRPRRPVQELESRRQPIIPWPPRRASQRRVSRHFMHGVSRASLRTSVSYRRCGVGPSSLLLVQPDLLSLRPVVRAAFCRDRMRRIETVDAARCHAAYWLRTATSAGAAAPSPLAAWPLLLSLLQSRGSEPLQY
jgi:hypothetical protein